MKSTGKIIYDPPSHIGNPRNWMIVMCDDEISSYYRSLFYREFPYYGKLTRPVFGAHISVIRGEKIPNYNIWKTDNLKTIEFEYEPGVIDNKEYYWMKVKCDYLLDLREKYGLKRHPQFGLHLTIGRTTQ